MQSRLSRGPTAHIVRASTAYALLPENSLWGGSFFEERCSSRCRPHCCWAGAVAVLVGMADGSDGGNEDGRAPIFFFSHQIQRPFSGIGSPPRGSSPRRKGSTLRLSSSEEGDGKDVDELSQSLMFAQTYCELIKTKYRKKCLGSGAHTHSALSRKKGGADRVFPHCNTFRSRQARSEECVRACDLVLRSRYCWGTVAIEITGIAHGSGGRLSDGLAPISTCIPQI